MRHATFLALVLALTAVVPTTTSNPSVMTQDAIVPQAHINYVIQDDTTMAPSHCVGVTWPFGYNRSTAVGPDFLLECLPTGQVYLVALGVTITGFGPDYITIAQPLYGQARDRHTHQAKPLLYLPPVYRLASDNVLHISGPTARANLAGAKTVLSLTSSSAATRPLGLRLGGALTLAAWGSGRGGAYVRGPTGTCTWDDRRAAPLGACEVKLAYHAPPTPPTPSTPPPSIPPSSFHSGVDIRASSLSAVRDPTGTLSPTAAATPSLPAPSTYTGISASNVEVVYPAVHDVPTVSTQDMEDTRTPPAPPSPRTPLDLTLLRTYLGYLVSLPPLHLPRVPTLLPPPTCMAVVFTVRDLQHTTDPRTLTAPTPDTPTTPSSPPTPADDTHTHPSPPSHTDITLFRTYACYLLALPPIMLPLRAPRPSAHAPATQHSRPVDALPTDVSCMVVLATVRATPGVCGAPSFTSSWSYTTHQAPIRAAWQPPPFPPTYTLMDSVTITVTLTLALTRDQRLMLWTAAGVTAVQRGWTCMRSWRRPDSRKERKASKKNIKNNNNKHTRPVAAEGVNDGTASGSKASSKRVKVVVDDTQPNTAVPAAHPAASKEEEPQPTSTSATTNTQSITTLITIHATPTSPAATAAPTHPSAATSLPGRTPGKGTDKKAASQASRAKANVAREAAYQRDLAASKVAHHESKVQPTITKSAAERAAAQQAGAQRAAAASKAVAANKAAAGRAAARRAAVAATTAVAEGKAAYRRAAGDMGIHVIVMWIFAAKCVAEAEAVAEEQAAEAERQVVAEAQAAADAKAADVKAVADKAAADAQAVAKQAAADAKAAADAHAECEAANKAVAEKAAADAQAAADKAAAKRAKRLAAKQAKRVAGDKAAAESYKAAVAPKPKCNRNKFQRRGHATTATAPTSGCSECDTTTTTTTAAIPDVQPSTGATEKLNSKGRRKLRRQTERDSRKAATSDATTTASILILQEV